MTIQILLLACTSTDAIGVPSDSESPTDPDRDDDGAFSDVDCDDRDPEVKPGADERCDGKDNDCDGLIDNDAIDALTMWVDADGDGWADASNESQHACTVPEGWAAQPGDCDDTDPALHPETEWFADSDLDGYGDALAAIQCLDPGGAVLLDGDCDDGDPVTHPSADEVCDSFDNDCDGTADEDPVDGVLAYVDADGDGYGDPDTAQRQCWLSEGDTLQPWDCDDSDEAIHPEATELCGDSIDSDCTGRPDNGCALTDLYAADQSFWAAGEGDAFGKALASVGDLDGDGLDDLAIGAPSSDSRGDGRGGAYVFSGSATPGGYEVGDALAVIDGSVDYAGVGKSVAGGRDVTGDGVPDLLVGGNGASDASCRTCGEMWLFAGPVQGKLTDEMATASFPWTGGIIFDLFGSAGELIDVNDDGHDDVVLIGQTLSVSASYTVEGAVYAKLGPVTGGQVDVTTEAEFSFIGSTGSHTGSGHALDDFTGDGLTDLLVGAEGYGVKDGHAWLVSGPLTGHHDSTTADFEMHAAFADDRLGARAVSGGDIDGDGYADALITAGDHDEGANSAGTVFVVSGPIDRDLDMKEVVDRVIGQQENAEFGIGLASGGADLDGDGFDDLLVGNHSINDGELGGGAAFVFHGPVSGPRFMNGADLTISAGTSGLSAGYALSWSGDLDGDSLPEVVVGAYRDSEGGSTHTFFSSGL